MIDRRVLRSAAAAFVPRLPAAVALPAVRLDWRLEREMTRVLAVVAPLVLLQSVPAFLAEHDLQSPWAPLIAVLALVCCACAPLGLLHGGRPTRRWFVAGGGAALLLVLLEPAALLPHLPSGYVPWLLAMSPMTTACVAVAARRSWQIAPAATAMVLGTAWDYRGRVAGPLLVIAGMETVLLVVGLWGTIRVLRSRARRADGSARAAALRFEEARRSAALERERVRTDSLLHDSVLNALLLIGRGVDETRAEGAARSALAVLDEWRGAPPPGATVRVGAYRAAVEQEFASIAPGIGYEVEDAAVDREMPRSIGQAFAAAMLQAVQNSVNHAGPGARCRVLVSPLGAQGIRVTVEDDGRGFDPAAVAPERLGVRVSILDRVRLAGGGATIRSAPGRGTVVELAWEPAIAPSTAPLLLEAAP